MGLIIALEPFISGLLLLLVNVLQFLFLDTKAIQTKILGHYLIVCIIERTACFGLYFVFSENNFFISHVFF